MVFHSSELNVVVLLPQLFRRVDIGEHTARYEHIATEVAVLFEDDDIRPQLGGADCGCHTRCAGAYHYQVGLQLLGCRRSLWSGSVFQRFDIPAGLSHAIFHGAENSHTRKRRARDGIELQRLAIHNLRSQLVDSRIGNTLGLKLGRYANRLDAAIGKVGFHHHVALLAHSCGAIGSRRIRRRQTRVGCLGRGGRTSHPSESKQRNRSTGERNEAAAAHHERPLLLSLHSIPFSHRNYPLFCEKRMPRRNRREPCLQEVLERRRQLYSSDLAGRRPCHTEGYLPHPPRVRLPFL